MYKPKCKLTGENGNIFNLISIATKVLKDADLIVEATLMQKECFESKSYEEALQVIASYVEVE